MVDSDRNIERYLKMLRDADIIEFKGDSPKTGGYYLTSTFHKIINNKNS